MKISEKKLETFIHEKRSLIFKTNINLTAGWTGTGMQTNKKAFYRDVCPRFGWKDFSMSEVYHRQQFNQ